MSDKSHGVIPLTPMTYLYDKNRSAEVIQNWLLRALIFSKNPWGTLQYKAGKYNKFKFDIALFRGVNESKRSYFAIDDIKVTKAFIFVNMSKEWLGANNTKFTMNMTFDQNSNTVCLSVTSCKLIHPMDQSLLLALRNLFIKGRNRETISFSLPMTIGPGAAHLTYPLSANKLSRVSQQSPAQM